MVAPVWLGRSYLFRIATREGAWLQRASGVAALLLFLLGGCTASAPKLDPTEYPVHSVALPTAEYPSAYPLPSVEPQIELHWRLIVDANRVRADGLIERQRESHIKDVWLQLVGLDATGRIVSFTPPTQFSWRSAAALESFTIALKPRGGEERYEVRLYMFEFEPQLTH
jgi:hypothetical protein